MELEKISLNKEKITSYSSRIMTQVTTFRNEARMCGRIITQPLFALIGICALVETVIFGIFTLLSILFLPFSTQPFFYEVQRLSSASFTVIWASVSFVINIFSPKLITDETSACAFAKRPGNL